MLAQASGGGGSQDWFARIASLVSILIAASAFLLNLRKEWSSLRRARRLIQGGAIDLVRSILNCNDQPSIKIAE